MSQMKEFQEEPGATLPVSDAERWIAGTYAIWSEYCGGSCKYLGGYEKTKSNAKMIAKVLEEDWMITDHDSGVDMIKYLLENAGPDSDEDDEGFEDDEEYDEDDEDFEDDGEYDEDDEDFEDDEEYDEDDEGFEDDEEYDEDDEGFEDDGEYDEDDEDFEDDEEYNEDEEDIEEDDNEDVGDDEEYDEEDFEDDEEYDDEEYDDYEVDTTAFDYACACNMCGRMFIAGYLTREEAMRFAAEAAKKIQELYGSWAEYFQAYIFGAAGGSNIKDIMPFAEAYQKVLCSPENPALLEWNTQL